MLRVNIIVSVIYFSKYYKDICTLHRLLLIHNYLNAFFCVQGFGKINQVIDSLQCDDHHELEIKHIKYKMTCLHLVVPQVNLNVPWA